MALIMSHSLIFKYFLGYMPVTLILRFKSTKFHDVISGTVYVVEVSADIEE
jgi:hypothetical protein